MLHVRMKWSLLLLLGTTTIRLEHVHANEPWPHRDALKFTCPDRDFSPQKLTPLSSDRGKGVPKYVLLPTISTSSSEAGSSAEGKLCTLTRLNNKFYIPIGKSYLSHANYDAWQLSPGRYLSRTSVRCDTTSSDGPTNAITGEPDYLSGEELCQFKLHPLGPADDGYYLQTHKGRGIASTPPRTQAARFLERTTWGATWEEISHLTEEYERDGIMAMAKWAHHQTTAVEPTSHRAYFRRRLNPRAVESYLYGIPGPKACEEDARFRRFAFTFKDVQLSRGQDSPAGNDGHPYTVMKIESYAGGGGGKVIKFGGEVRTVTDGPLQYEEDGNLIDLADGDYTICNVHEVADNELGGLPPLTYTFQVLVDTPCTSSYTNRDGLEDNLGDGSIDFENKRVSGRLIRSYDSAACNAKCNDKSKVKLIITGNPTVQLPADDVDLLGTLSWIDLSALAVPEELTILEEERTHESNWLLRRDLDTCFDQNGDEFLDPAGLAFTDLRSTGRGKFNIDKPIFAKMPNNKWALHDFRTQFHQNTMEEPMMDGGGSAMKRAARSGANDDGVLRTDLVTRCSNVQRNIFNEPHCKISYHPDACVSVPLPDQSDGFRRYQMNPGGPLRKNQAPDPVYKYTPPYAGEDYGGVVVCGSANEVAPDPMEDDTFDVTNRKLHSPAINYNAQKKGVWAEVILSAEDQLCQKMGWALSKIFATSTGTNADSSNSETNINVMDNFVTSCFSTYKDVVKKVSFNEEMGAQLTFLRNKAVHTDWHIHNKLAWPDENYARENLQLHSIGLIKLHDDGTPILDQFGRRIPNYNQKHIFTAAKIWTGFNASYRRGNYEDLDWATTSYLDPLQISSIRARDWFPKIDFESGYIGDTYPLCADLPRKHFLKKNAMYRLLGGSPQPLWHWQSDSTYYDQEFEHLTLTSTSSLYEKLCNPKSTQPPATSLAAGTGSAEYNAALSSAPLCQGSESFCDSNSLLEGRGVNEANSHNTIDDCTDGTDTTYDESVKKIVVSTMTGDDLRGGELVKIEATVISNRIGDVVDFYYTDDATSDPHNWLFITRVSPPVAENIVSVPNTDFPEITYTLPKCVSPEGCRQAVRVVLRSRRAASRFSHSSTRPKSTCESDQSYGIYDDADDLAFDVLPSYRAKDLCEFQTLVTLDENLLCDKRECAVDTVRVVEVVPGVYYEYIHAPCVYLPFYNNPVKLFAGWNNDVAMCGDKKLPSALSTCCGTYSDRLPNGFGSWADVLSEYRYERLTYKGNEDRCEAWGRSVCDPQRIGPFTGWTGHCFHRQSCRDVASSTAWLIDHTRFQWTTASCTILVKVQPDGTIAIIHEPERTQKTLNTQVFPHVQSHVHPEKTRNYFYVQWDPSKGDVGKLDYPHVSDNNCDGGTVEGDTCLCVATVADQPMYSSIPSRSQVLALKVGAFDPTLYEEYHIVQESNDVSVYKRDSSADDYTTKTIFRVMKDDEHVFFKNVLSVVNVCDGEFEFRNSPTFYDIANPELVSAYQETDAYIDYVHNHASAPPFVCTSLLKQFGYSNPTPLQTLECSNAFKTGVFTFDNPTNPSDTLSFGVAGQRGNLAAVAASIILSDEALTPTVDLDPAAGGIKSPLLKLTQVMRSFKLTRTLHHRRTDGFFSAGAFGENPYGIPDQFSFYDPHFIPSGAHREAYLMAPEAGILNLGYMVKSQNALHNLFRMGMSACDGGIGPFMGKGKVISCGNRDGFFTNSAGYLDYTPDGVRSSSSNVVGQLATILTADRISPSNRALIEEAYSDNYNAVGGGAKAALEIAQVLMTTTPEFHTTNNVALNDDARSLTPRREKDNSPYKAIIHVNLFGGMDSMSMLAPHPDGCQALYNEYKKARGSGLFLEPGEMEKILVTGSTSDPQPCTSFGVHSSLSALADIYNDGDGIFFTNIGHLQKQVNRHNFETETTAQLFSHHSMKEESFNVDAFNERDNSGVLGRMTDVLGNSMATAQIAIDKSLSNLVGDPTLGRKVDIISRNGNGVDQLYRVNLPGPTESKRNALLDTMSKLNSKTNQQSGIHAELWSQVFVDSKHESEEYREWLSSEKGNTSMGAQLNMIFRLIKLRETRNVNRDVFSCELGGFDQHFDLKSGLGGLFSQINNPLKEFRNALINEGIDLWNSVTLIMTSEFGRTTTPNASGGTDHGWGGNYFMMGGKVKGGRILGQHPANYNLSDPQITGRGAWIPTTSNEAMWYGITQWFGITSELALNYVLPNVANFGCRLYSETQLFEEGTGNIPSCGGDTVQVEQTFFVTEPRLLNPDEQVSFCQKVVDAMGDVEVKCVVLNQLLSSAPGRRHLSEGFVLKVDYQISSSQQGVADLIVESVSDDEFQAGTVEALDLVDTVEGARVVTSAPTSSPTASPTSSPTRPDVCSILTEDVFNSLAPNAADLYSYASFCTAVDSWNTNNAENADAQIFMEGTEMLRRHELAAFFGNLLQESAIATTPLTWNTFINDWMNGGSHDSVISLNDFGGTVNVTSEDDVCPATGEELEESVASRLNKYCFAATQLGVDALLSFDDCAGLQTQFDKCVDVSAPPDSSCADCRVWEGITNGPTTSPSQMPTQTPSKSPTAMPTTKTQRPTNSPSKIPTSSPTFILAPFYGYDFVGGGNCHDNLLFSIRTYDYLLFRSISSLNECPRVCAPYRDNPAFHGLEYASSSLDSNDGVASSCKCLFEDNTDLDGIVNNYGGHDVSDRVTTGKGSGAIVGFESESFVECYKVVPLVPPVIIPRYDYVGPGQCLDSEGAQYDFLASVEESFISCEAACSSIQSPRGIWLQEDSIKGNVSCNCLYDDNTQINGQTLVDPSNGNGGTGQIMTSNYSGGHCYGLVPPPTMGPTTTPSTSPTSSPSTKEPTSSPSKSPSTSPSQAPSISIPTGSPPTISPSELPPWEINFISISAYFNASAPATDEDLLLTYEVGKGKEHVSLLYAGPCIDDTSKIHQPKLPTVITQKNDSITMNANPLMSTLELGYTVDTSLITASNIWNDTTSQIQLCQVLQLVENDSQHGKLVIEEDIRDVTIGINSFLNFSFGFDLVGATIEAVNKTTSLSSFISSYICSGDDTLKSVDKDFELGPNEKLHVCFVSRSTDVEISKVTSMVINGTDRSGDPMQLTVLTGGGVFLSSITSVRYVNPTSAICTTRVPINMFDYERADAKITIKGSIAMILQGDKTGRQLLIKDQVSTKNRNLQQLDNGEDEEVQFGISVNLKHSDVVREEHISLWNSASKILTSISSLIVVAYIIW